MERVARALQRAAKESTERLADEIWRLVLDSSSLEGDRNDPIEVLLPRLLSEDLFTPLRNRIASAMAHGVRTWRIQGGDNSARLIIAQLARCFSSPQLSVAIATRMLSTQAQDLTGDGRFDDLFLDAILLSATDETVRNRLVEITNRPEFRRFSIVILYRLARIDLDSIPLIIGPALDEAERVLNSGNRPAYIVGFENLLTPADVQSVIKRLSGDDEARFYWCFLWQSSSYSVQFAGVNPLESPFDLGGGLGDPPYGWELVHESGVKMSGLDPSIVAEGELEALRRDRPRVMEATPGIAGKSLEPAV